MDVEGGPVGQIEYETSTLCRAEFVFKERTFLGTFKDTMVARRLLAHGSKLYFQSSRVPEHTTGHEGFYRLSSCRRCCGKAKLVYILRDHSRELFNATWCYVSSLLWIVNRITVDLRLDEYYNMAEVSKKKDFRCSIGCGKTSVRKLRHRSNY